MSDNFTVVICPGAWPLVDFHEPLGLAFEDRNHPAICQIRDSNSPYDPKNPPTINPDSEHLRDEVLQPLVETGVDVVVFMHSYGGVYAAESLEGLSKKERSEKGLRGGIIAVILNAAFVAPKGTTALDAMKIDVNNIPTWIFLDPDTGLTWMNKGLAMALLFHDLPDQEAGRLATSLPKQPLACFSTPTRWDPYQDPYYDGIIGYIYTEADKIHPVEAQRMAVAQGGTKHTYLMENSSHSPHLEQPENLADIVIQMVHQMTKSSE